VGDKNNKWVKGQWMKMPHRGKFRKAIVKFVMGLTPNSRSTHHLKRYFQTGKISKQAASQVWRDWSRLIDSVLLSSAVVIWLSMWTVLPIHGATFLLIPIIKLILQAAKDIMLPDLLPGGVEARNHLIKR